MEQEADMVGMAREALAEVETEAVELVQETLTDKLELPTRGREAEAQETGLLEVLGGLE